MEEFFHCYRPSEIVQSRGIYSFLLRKPSLRLVCKTPDSNRNWKSRYFFIQGDNWMCHPNDQENMPVDKTWGIMPPSGRCPSILSCIFISCLICWPNHHPLLQPWTIQRLPLSSGASWRRSPGLSWQRRRGKSLSPWTPFIGIVRILCQQLSLVATIVNQENVSPSLILFFFQFLVIHLTPSLRPS